MNERDEKQTSTTSMKYEAMWQYHKKYNIERNSSELRNLMIENGEWKTTNSNSSKLSIINVIEEN